ncbi:MAG: MotA/TolQ/ExbB proton channel family protein [Candidatus Glassbacteria bacterium]|nr:MotA/TolQ/ExbB proton channel family protein [Candidatus Glassbacteria bacterium]
MLELFKQGGILMYPLALCSVMAVAIILERWYNLRHSGVIRSEIIQVIENIKGPEDLGLAYSICEKNPGPFSSIVLTALRMKDLPKEEIKEAILDAGRQQTRRLERGLVVLETVAGISPLLGILGTVFGMITIFHDITQFGIGQASALASGIQLALITTATGLCIGIPALVGFNYFTNKVEGLVLELEYYAGVLLNKLDSFQQARPAFSPKRKGAK